MRTMVAVALAATTLTAQAQEVQVMNFSPYAETAVFDVYRDGELWRDNFTFASATPLEPWSGPGNYRLDFVWPNAVDASQPFHTETVTLRRGRDMILAFAGKPNPRPGERAFDVHYFPGNALRRALPVVGIDGVGLFATARFIPDGPTRTTMRDFRSSDGSNELQFGASPWGFDCSTQTTLCYSAAAARIWESDSRRFEDFRIFSSTVSDMSDVSDKALIVAVSGFIQPPRTGDQPHQVRVVYADGQVVPVPLNVAKVQFLHTHPGISRVSIRVTRRDNLAEDVVDELAHSLGFREATPVLELASGVIVSGEKVSAPKLLIEALDLSSDPPRSIASLETRLRYGDSYLVSLQPATLEGDSAAGPPELRLKELPLEAESDSTYFMVNGIVDLLAISLRRQSDPLALAFLPMGDSESLRTPLARQDTLLLTPAGRSRELARFPLSAAPGDSTRLLVASGYADPTGTDEPAAGLFLVPPSGGPFIALERMAPPPPWTTWWFWAILVAVAAAFGLAFNQARVMRLRARQKELGLLVDERTRELQAEKEKTEAQALRLTELDEAKNRFFANISHEFRTPLTLILGPVQDALDGYFGALEPKLASQMGVMHRSARRLLRLINQLLDLSKLESGKMALATRLDDLAAFTGDLARSFVPLAERRGIALIVDVPDDVMACRFDADAMEKVISNLLSNALKFTPDEGKVQLSVRAEDMWIRIAVRDNGPGISEDDLARIFDRFQQADSSIRRKFEGSGIGLTLAKELVELHNGTITVESVLGFGTSFTVTLPRSTEPMIARSDTGVRLADSTLLEEALLSRPVADLEAEADDAAGSIVLVVEDNPDVRAYLHQHLSERYQVIEAVDGQDGWEKAKEHPPALVLSDVMMPRVDGYELCKRIKADETLRHTPVILLTAKAGEADTIAGLEGGADAYVAKPFSVKALLLRVANLIASRREMREQLSKGVMVGDSDIAITSDEAAFMAGVIEQINTHLGNADLSIDWLADEVGVSRSEFERRVQEATHLTPAQLVRKMRLKRASQLLRAKAGTVAEIGYAVGFRSPSHFAKTYKAAYGESPMALGGTHQEMPTTLTGLTISHYEIGQKIGAGGMGVVYRARDIILDREVAMKVLPARLTSDEEASARFMQEAKAVSALDHPNLCAIYDIGETEHGALFMVMPFYAGQTIGAMIADGSLDVERSLEFARAIADGLASAHASGVVHRDIKPENVIVTEAGVPKILDFGVAKLSEDMHLTQPGSTVGTAAYMSPEQLRGEVVDARSDLWSLGVVLYEMLAGHAPFDGEYAAARSYQILNEPHRELPSDIPQEARDIIDSLLGKEASDRPQSAGDVAAKLRDLRTPVATA